MKKFYTLLAATALSIGTVSAASALNEAAGLNLPAKTEFKKANVKQAELNVSEITKVNNKVNTRKALSTRAGEISNAAELTGEYAIQVYGAIGSNSNGLVAGTALAGTTLIQGNADNTVTLQDFIIEGVNPTGTYDPQTNLITIPAGQTFVVSTDEGNENATPYVFDFATKAATDIQLEYDPYSGGLVFIANYTQGQGYDSCLMIGLSDAEVGYGFLPFCYAVEFLPCNAYMTYTSAPADGSADATDGLAFLEVVDTVDEDGNTVANSIDINWMFNYGIIALNDYFGFPVTLTIDTDAKKATATEQACGIFATSSTSYDIVFLTYYDYTTSAVNQTIEFDITVDKSKEYPITILEPTVDVLSTLATQSGWLYDYAETLIVIPGLDLLDNDGNDGIEGIAADNAANNAPVEYFNLQGVRVANPEAGQLVIRRQGSNISKQIVR